MTARSFVRENLVLVIGLTLPALLIVIFFVASVLPKSMGTPPQYELLFSTVQYAQAPSPYIVNFVVKDGMLYARVNKSDSKNYSYNNRKLMAYDGKTENVREISYDVSKVGDIAATTDIALEETKSMKLDSSTRAPDGYIFEPINYSSSGMVTELFGVGYRNHGPRIKKGSVAYKVSDINTNYYYGDVQFIGWVVGNK